MTEVIEIVLDWGMIELAQEGVVHYLIQVLFMES